MVTVGQKAPDFIAPALAAGEGVVVELFKQIRTSSAVVLYFYPADFVPECTAELRAIRDAGWHTHDDLTVIGLSGDSLFSHAAYARQESLPFILVSDFHGGIAESYDLLAEEWEGHSHIPERAAVVIGGDWEVLAVEGVSNPLKWADPAPVERLETALESAGVAVELPAVRYD